MNSNVNQLEEVLLEQELSQAYEVAAQETACAERYLGALGEVWAKNRLKEIQTDLRSFFENNQHTLPVQVGTKFLLDVLHAPKTANVRVFSVFLLLYVVFVFKDDKTVETVFYAGLAVGHVPDKMKLLREGANISRFLRRLHEKVISSIF